MTRSSYRWQGIITALSPIHHGGDGSDGTIKPFATQKVISADGETVTQIPRISGNSIRGQWRDVAARTLLRLLEVPEHSLTPAAFYFLFSGGALSKGDSGVKVLNLPAARDLAALVPSVALFGGGVGTMLLPGKLKVGDALPLCRETAHLVPEAYQDRCLLSIWDLRDMQQFSRMDDARRLDGMEFLPPVERQALEAPRQAAPKKPRATAGLFGDEEPTPEPERPAPVQKAEPGVAVMMRYGFEVLAAGTQFAHSIGIFDASPLELSTLFLTLQEWSRDAHLGGRSAQGWGKIAVRYDDWITIDPLVQVSQSLVRAQDGLLSPEMYTEHVTERRDAILSALAAF